MKKLIYLFSMLLITALTSVSLASCSNDDEDGTKVDGQKVSASDLIGKSFSKKSISYTDYDDVPYKEEETHTITFTSSSNCVHDAKGYDYIWDFGYKKRWWNHSYNCTYTISGSTITVYNYRDNEDKEFTYTGSSIVCGDEVFNEN